MLTGASPFPHLSNDVQVGREVDRGERPALPAPSSDLTMSSMVNLIERMWDEHPSKRPQAVSVHEELVRAAALAEAHRIGAAGGGGGRGGGEGGGGRMGGAAAEQVCVCACARACVCVCVCVCV